MQGAREISKRARVKHRLADHFLNDPSIVQKYHKRTRKGVYNQNSIKRFRHVEPIRRNRKEEKRIIARDKHDKRSGYTSICYLIANNSEEHYIGYNLYLTFAITAQTDKRIITDRRPTSETSTVKTQNGIISYCNNSRRSPGDDNRRECS